MFYDFQGIENVRELGGLTRQDGASIRPNSLFRTGMLRQATDQDIQRLQDFGVRAVIDLRDGWERHKEPDRDVPGAVNYHIPAVGNLADLFARPADSEDLTPAEIHGEFRRLYQHLATTPESDSAYERFFQTLLAQEGGPVLFHCTQGKDRTGVASMLLLAALGFDEEIYIEEYMRTNIYMQAQLDGLVREGQPEERVALMREILLVFRENAMLYLHCLQVEYGSVPNYLELVLGIGPAEVKKLEDFYLT